MAKQLSGKQSGKVRVVGGGGHNPSKSVGRPGFKRIIKSGMIHRGGAGQTGVMPARSVKRFFKRNPANRTAIIGTSKDKLGDTNQKWNRTPTPSPSVDKKVKVVTSADRGNAKREKRQPVANYKNRKLKKY